MTDIFLFDLDGTLIDSGQDIAASANAAREAVGLAPRPLPEILPFIGEGARRLIERTLGDENAERVSEALMAWSEHYAAHMFDTTRVYAGLTEALERMEGARAVVTNKPGPLARALVERLGLARLFPVVLGSGDGAARKPDPEGIFLALRSLGVEGRSVLIGDSAIDAATARAAGIGFVGVLWGLRPREELIATGGPYLAEVPSELPETASRALRSVRSETTPENPAAMRPLRSTT